MSLMKIESFHAYRVHDIPEQIRRKMAVNTSFTTLDDVKEAVSRFGADATVNGDFRGLLSDVASYDTTENGYDIPSINIGADNDMTFFNQNSQIYNFIAVVTVSPANEVRLTEDRCIIVGYTSEVSPSFGGFLPDDMKMFINDIYSLRVSYAFGPTGNRFIPENGMAIIDNYVLANTLPQTYAVGSMPEAYVLPDNMMSIAALQKDYDINGGAGESINHAASFRDVPQCVSANMVSPEQFALHATGGYLNGLQCANEIGSEFATWGSSASSQTSQFFRDKRLTQTLGNQKFVRKLRDHLASSGLVANSNAAVNSGAFTLADMKMCIGNAAELDRWISESVTLSEQNMSPDLGADIWGTGTMGSLVSYDIANRLGSIMAKHQIGGLQFAFSTQQYVDGVLGRPVIIPQSLCALDRNGHVPQVLLSKFREQLEYNLIATVTKGLMIPMECRVMSALGGATRVEILIDGSSSWEAYTYASFMSGRLNTTTTGDTNYIQTLANSLGNFTAAVGEGFQDHLNGQAHQMIYSDVPDNQNSGLFGGGTDNLFSAPETATGAKLKF